MLEGSIWGLRERLTVLKVHRNVVAADVRRHSDDGCGVVELPDEMRGGDTVEVGHYYIHQDKVVFVSVVEFVHSFQSVELVIVSLSRRKHFHLNSQRCQSTSGKHRGTSLQSSYTSDHPLRAKSSADESTRDPFARSSFVPRVLVLEP